MIATAGRVDLRGPTEVGQPDDQRLFQQAALFEVDQQLRQPAINLRDQVVLQGFEVVLVSVPAAVGDRDEADSRLDQPPGEQALLTERVATVLLAQLGVFLVELERAAGVVRGDHVECRGVVLIERIELGGLQTGGPLQGIDEAQHLAAAINSFVRDAGRRSDVSHDEVLGVRVGHDRERIVFQTENPRCPASKTAIDRVAQLNERRHRRLETHLVRDDRSNRRVRHRGIELPAGHQMLVGNRVAPVHRVPASE